MEGITDGRAVDTCFHCGLLYPEACARDCPRCGRRMRYQPAIFMDEPALRDALRARADAYAGAAGTDARRRCLHALLALVHDHAPASLRLLAELGGPDLDALRRAYEAL